MSTTSTAGPASPETEGLSQSERAQAARDEESVRRGFWRKLQGTAARIPFAQEATASYYAALDRETPLKVRATLLGALAYFVLPVDFAPDLFPLVGFTDDAAVLMAAMRLLSSHVHPRHHAAARDALEQLRHGRD
ncbi:YkvA family protein [Xanthobacter sp. AM11]|uniref:YkvA family protein n=1 Tax=Xanthobacter sp. AM11 TaxID=3380643 RepID=UPI0039BFEF61